MKQELSYEKRSVLGQQGDEARGRSQEEFGGQGALFSARSCKEEKTQSGRLESWVQVLEKEDELMKRKCMLEQREETERRRERRKESEKRGRGRDKAGRDGQGEEREGERERETPNTYVLLCGWT